MANLFLDGMFNMTDTSPSSVRIFVPNADTTGYLQGLMTGEPSISAQNQWGTIINDLSNFQDFVSLMGINDQWSWIGASTMCWKGTRPLSVNFEFYLINYKRGLPFESKARGGQGLLQKFMQLASLQRGDSESAFANYARVKAHGGYVADVLSHNSEYFDENVKKNDTRVQSVGSLTHSKDETALFDSAYSEPGTCVVTFGRKLTIKNLLLSRVDVTPSVVEVAGQDGSDRRPLYYRVNAGFTGVRALLYNDIDAMWGGM